MALDKFMTMEKIDKETAMEYIQTFDNFFMEIPNGIKPNNVIILERFMKSSHGHLTHDFRDKNHKTLVEAKETLI